MGYRHRPPNRQPRTYILLLYTMPSIFTMGYMFILDDTRARDQYLAPLRSQDDH